MDNQTNNNKITNLIDRYINSSSNSKENNELIEWLESCEDSEDIEFGEFVVDTNHSIEHKNQLRREATKIIEDSKYKKRALKRAQRFNFRRVVAAASIAALFIFSLSIYNTIKESNIEYYTETSGVGEIKEVTLCDGTSVILNSSSELTISSNFNRKNREVKLDGEAFFDVAPNKDKPFIIRSGKTNVRVVGTSFNLKSYKEDNTILLSVATGKVALEYNNSELYMTLTKDQSIKIDKISGNFQKSTSTHNPSQQWRDGVLVFDQTPLEEVVKELNRHHKTALRLENIDKKHIISGMHGNSDLESVVESICHITSLRYRYNGDTLIIYNHE